MIILNFKNTSQKGILSDEDYEKKKDRIQYPYTPEKAEGDKIDEYPMEGGFIELWKINNASYICFRYIDISYSFLGNRLPENEFVKFIDESYNLSPSFI
jgi:hypothetical protein